VSKSRRSYRIDRVVVEQPFENCPILRRSVTSRGDRPKRTTLFIGEENSVDGNLEGLCHTSFHLDLGSPSFVPLYFQRRSLFRTDLSPSMSRSISSVAGSPLYRKTICFARSCFLPHLAISTELPAYRMTHLTAFFASGSSARRALTTMAPPASSILKIAWVQEEPDLTSNKAQSGSRSIQIVELPVQSHEFYRIACKPLLAAPVRSHHGANSIAKRLRYSVDHWKFFLCAR
jgi:hypothetical protein